MIPQHKFQITCMSVRMCVCWGTAENAAVIRLSNTHSSVVTEDLACIICISDLFSPEIFDVVETQKLAFVDSLNDRYVMLLLSHVFPYDEHGCRQLPHDQDPGHIWEIALS